MKTKNVVLALFAFTLAIGGAFASMFAPEAVWVRAKLTSTGAARCIQTTAECDHAGAFICTVTVPTTAVGDVETVTTDGSSGFIAYRAGCLVALNNANSNPISANPSQAIYQLTTQQP
jgi:hypothetical protein